MPPYYPNQFPGQYPGDAQYYDQYNQLNQYRYGHPTLPSHRAQPIPPYSQIEINIPPRSAQPQSFIQPQPQPQHLQHPYPGGYPSNLNYQNYQNIQQQLYIPQYQPPLPQQYYQQMPPQPQHRQPPPPQQPSVPSRVLQDVQSNASRQPTFPKPPTETTVEIPEPDYAIVLLSLSDEYLEAATKLPSRSEAYYKLTATALGCIQSVLTNFKLPALREAQTSLKFAQLLYNETENYDEAESVLTKTVELCERMKFLDLKYGAQLLLAQVLHRSNPRAALKDLERMIDDIAAYRHVAWEYAFRLQHAMFLTFSGQSNDIHAAIVQFEKIAAVAKKNEDHVVYAFAAILESFTHLRSSSSDAVTASQTALATARSVQLNPHILGNSQMMVMMEFVDLCAAMKSCNIAQSEQKRKPMQKLLYQALENSEGWRSDGIMYISLKSSSLKGFATQDGGLIIERNHMHFLALQWLSQDEVEDMGYLLSGVSAALKNAGDSGKAEKFLEEGLEMLRDIMKDKQTTNGAGDLIRARRQLIECHFLLERACLQCTKGQWNKASAAVNLVEEIANSFDDQFSLDMQCLVDYIRGSIAQGTGDLSKALEIYNLPHLQIQPATPLSTSARAAARPQKQSETMRDISILACMNTILIIQNPSHSQHNQLQQLVNTLDNLAHNHPSKTIQAAYNFVLASLPKNTILKMKQYLSHSLTAAQTVCNAQITTLCLVTMQEKFFKGVIGDQALKCAKAATHQARRLNEPLWISVAMGLESECLSMHGMNEEAVRKKEDAAKVMSVLPGAVRTAVS